MPDPAPITGELSDEDLRAEIELLADVIAAVGHRHGRLRDTEIDRLLGVEPRRAPPRRGGAP